MVTAEIAVAMPALALVLLLCLWGIASGAAMLRCSDAARLAARAMARGDSDFEVRRLIASTAPDGASSELYRQSATVTVVVRTTVARPGALRFLIPALSVRGRAVAPTEPTR